MKTENLPDASFAARLATTIDGRIFYRVFILNAAAAAAHVVHAYGRHKGRRWRAAAMPRRFIARLYPPRPFPVLFISLRIILFVVLAYYYYYYCRTPPPPGLC